MNAIGNWLNGSGWVEVFERGSEFSLASVESFLHGNKVKRCRYAHQVSLAAFQRLARDAYTEETKMQSISYDDWISVKSEGSVNAHYWFQLMSLDNSVHVCEKFTGSEF